MGNTEEQDPVLENQSVELGSSQSKLSRKVQFVTAIIICLNGVLNGCAIAWSSFAGMSLEQNVGTSQASWTIACFPIAAMLFSIPVGRIVQRFGPKATLLVLGSIPSFVGWIIISLSFHYAWIGRLFLGLASATVTVVVPVYCEEITVDIKVRGCTGVFFDLMMGSGILWPNFVSMLTVRIHEHINNNNKTSSYQIISDDDLFCVNLSCAVVVSLIGVALLLIPESPIYLLSRGKYEKARKVLQRLQAPPALAQQTFDAQDLKCVVTWKARLLVFGLIVAQQFSGIDVVMFYMEELFVKSEMGVVNGFGPREATVVACGIQVLSSMSASLCVDRFGRRPLLIISEILMIISFVCLSAHAGGWIGFSWLPLVAIPVYLIGFTLGIGPLPWLLMAELIPGGGWATGAVVTTHWGLEMLLTSFCPYVIATWGVAVNYAFLAICCFLGLIFVYYAIPETKGLKRSEIQQAIQSVKLVK